MLLNKKESWHWNSWRKIENQSPTGTTNISIFQRVGEMGRGQSRGKKRGQWLWTAIIRVHVCLSHWIIETSLALIVEVRAFHSALEDQLLAWMSEFLWMNEWTGQNQTLSAVRLLPGVMLPAFLLDGFSGAMLDSSSCLYGTFPLFLLQAWSCRMTWLWPLLQFFIPSQDVNSWAPSPLRAPRFLQPNSSLLHLLIP